MNSKDRKITIKDIPKGMFDDIPEGIVTEYSKKIKRERKRKLKKYKLKTNYELTSKTFISLSEHLIEYKPINFEKDTNYPTLFNFNIQADLYGDFSIDQIFFDLRYESTYLKYALPVFGVYPLLAEGLIQQQVPEKIANAVYKFAFPSGRCFGVKKFSEAVTSLIGEKNYNEYGKLFLNQFFWGEASPNIFMDYQNKQSIYFLCFYEDAKKLAEINYPYSIDPFIDDVLRTESYILNYFINHYKKFENIVKYYDTPEFYPDYFDTNFIIGMYKNLCEYVKKAFPLKDAKLFNRVDKSCDDLIKAIIKTAKLLGYIESGGRPRKNYPSKETLRKEYKQYLNEFEHFVNTKYADLVYSKRIGKNEFVALKTNTSSKIYDQIINEFWITQKDFNRKFLDRLPLDIKEINTVPRIVHTILSASHEFASSKSYMQYLKPLD